MPSTASSRRWSALSDNSIRIELAFDGGQIIGATVQPDTADTLERAVNAGSGGAVQLDTEDGRLTVVVPRVVYLKRYPPGSQVGFGA
jgi:hypothetical protein